MSDLEEKLAKQLQDAGISFVPQYKFHPTRKFLADFSVMEYQLLIEVNGGIFMKRSGHNSGVGITRDYHKSNFAQMMGLVLLAYTADDIKTGYAIKEIVAYIEKKKKGES